MVSGVVIWAFILSVNLLFPPRRDPSGIIHVLGTNLPPSVYGAIIGLVIGSAQAAVLRQYLRHRLLWTVASSLAVATAFPFGLAVANLAGSRLGPSGFFVGYFVGVALLGVLVGVGQSLLLNSGTRSAVRWILWSTVAVPAGLLTGIACEFVFRATPSTWYGLALAFAVYPAVIGLVIGALTVRPLTTLLSQRSLTHE
jgi:hypothetical protein